MSKGLKIGLKILWELFKLSAMLAEALLVFILFGAVVDSYHQEYDDYETNNADNFESHVTGFCEKAFRGWDWI